MKKFIGIFLAMFLVSSSVAFALPSVKDAYVNNYIATATTTVVKTGAGILHAITVEGGTAGTIIVYDNTAATGTILASFSSTNALQTYVFDVTFATGLTVITSAATQLSVSYK